MKKRLLSVLLVMSLCLSLLPTTVWAEEDELLGDDTLQDSSTSTLKHGSTTLYYDSLGVALNDASDGDIVTLLSDCTLSTDEPYPIDAAITLDLATVDLTISSFDNPKITSPLLISNGLTVLNGTIIGGLTVTGGTVTVSGGEIGVKGPINITNNASVTISGSTRAVESTSKANVPLYGSTEVDG